MSSGLQAERTELAWWRTALSCWAGALIALKVTFPLGVLALAGPLAITVVCALRKRRLRAGGEPPAMHRRAGLALAAATLVTALAGAGGAGICSAPRSPRQAAGETASGGPAAPAVSAWRC